MLSLLLVAALATTPAVPDTAVLRVENRTVMVFRAPIGAMNPAERATLAERWITEAIETRQRGVTTRPAAEGYVVSVGERRVFTIMPTDVDTLGGVTLKEHAAATVSELQKALEEYREARSISSILKGVIGFIVATGVLIIALMLLRRGRRRLMKIVQARVDNGAPRARIKGVSILSSDLLQETGRFLATVIHWAIGLVIGYVYLTFVLECFPQTRPWGEKLGGYITATLERLGLGVLHSIPNLLTVFVIFIATRFVARIVGSLFDAVSEGKIELPFVHADTAAPTRRIAVVLVWLLGLVMAYPYLPGSDSAAFKGISVFGGLLLTLGSTGPMGQAIAGLVLMYARSFKVGDVVEVGGNRGLVVRMGVVSTQIRTPKNEYITVPNSVMVSGSVTNFSKGSESATPLIIYSSVTIGYDTPWRQIHELMVSAGKKMPEALATPEPWVLQRALNDWYVEYQVNVAIDSKDAIRMPMLYSQLHGNIQDAFWAAGVEIMSPTYVAVRDGNTVTIPEEQRPKTRTPVFRVDVNPE